MFNYPVHFLFRFLLAWSVGSLLRTKTSNGLWPRHGKPVFHQYMPLGSKYGFRVELHPAHIVPPVRKRHYLPVAVPGRNIQARREILVGNDPRMVTPHGELTAKAVENRVLPDYLNRGCHPVIHMREIFQMRPETFANRLMAQAYSENALMWRITTQKFGKYSRFAWQARPRRYDHTLVRSGLFDAYTVVAVHISIVTQ